MTGNLGVWLIVIVWLKVMRRLEGVLEKCYRRSDRVDEHGLAARVASSEELGGGATGEAAKVADEVGLVEIPAADGQVGPVDLGELARGGDGLVEAEKTGERLG